MAPFRATAVAFSLCATRAHGLARIDGDAGAIAMADGDAGSDWWPFGHKAAAPGAPAKNVTVILNGEPKSGTTWLEYVAKEILTEVCAKEPGCQLLKGANGRDLVAHRGSGSVAYDMDTKHEIPNVGHKNAFDFSIAPSMTDAQVEAAAKATLDGAAESAKWLVIFRDPRDVTISSCYHMVKNCPNPSGYVGGKIGRITEWINLRYRLFDALRKLAPDRVLMLYYEEMKRDEQGTIGRLADYFGVPLNKKQGMLISSRTTFSAMKDSGSKIAQGGAASGKVREGASCGYAKELDADSAKRITDMMRRDLSPALNAVWAC